jgi:hypothetical protein
LDAATAARGVELAVAVDAEVGAGDVGERLPPGHRPAYLLYVPTRVEVSGPAEVVDIPVRVETGRVAPRDGEGIAVGDCPGIDAVTTRETLDAATAATARSVELAVAVDAEVGAGDVGERLSAGHRPAYLLYVPTRIEVGGPAEVVHVPSRVEAGGLTEVVDVAR